MKQELRAQLKNLRILLIKQYLNFFRNLFDIPVILFFMDSPYVNQKFAGLLGTVTSSISLYGLWGSWWMDAIKMIGVIRSLCTECLTDIFFIFSEKPTA